MISNRKKKNWNGVKLIVCFQFSILFSTIFQDQFSTEIHLFFLVNFTYSSISFSDITDTDIFSSGLQPFWDDFEFPYHEQKNFNEQIEAGKYISISLVLHSGAMAFIWWGQQNRWYVTNLIVSWYPSDKTNLSSHLFWFLLYLLALF